MPERTESTGYKAPKNGPRSGYHGDKARAAEQARKKKLDGLLQRLEDGTREVFESENYKRMLTTMAKFHDYSINNMILIAMQRPDASLVAGFRAWQTKFNRQVKKGEKGIQIVGYAPRTITTAEVMKNEIGVPILGADGEPMMETVRKQIPAFQVMYVFDVSQTEGEPLPTLGVAELTGDVERFNALRDALLALSPVPVVFEAFESAAKGKMDHDAQQITVQPNMSQTQTIKTLVHEIAHAQMHCMDDERDRRTKEVEAESVAFVTCQYLGIDTGDYSFPYVASWSDGKELQVLRESLDRIRSQATENIERLEAALSPVREQTPERDQSAALPRFADCLAQATQAAKRANELRLAGNAPAATTRGVGWSK